MPKQVPSKRKRIVLTLKQKMEICKRLEKGESRAVLMEEFNVGSSTIYDIKAQSQKIKEFYVKLESDKSVEKRHTLHTPKMEVLDQALYEWFLLKKSEGGCISGPMLQEKAREFHEKMNIEGQCSFSSGWLTRFKVRHGIRKMDLSAEQKSADFEVAASFRDMFSELVVENGMTPEQIYNADESGLMWKCLPHSTLSGGNKNVAHRFKLNKEHITVLVSANASGNHKEKVSWQRAIAAFETLIAFAEQRPFFTSQHVMQLHIMQNLTLRERRRASKQADVLSFFKKAVCKFASTAASTDVDPNPPTSTSPDPVLTTSSDPDNPDVMSTQ